MIIAVTTTAIRRERDVIKWDSLTADCRRLLLQGQHVNLGNVFMYEHPSDGVFGGGRHLLKGVAL
jgi:hypothetical protein